MIKLKTLLTETSGSKRFIAYHGTGSRFRKFNLKKSTQEIIWFTTNKDNVLKNETGASGKGFIITAELTINSPAGWDEYEKYFLEQLRSEGYDGCILPDGQGFFDCFVFSSAQIKILKIEKA